MGKNKILFVYAIKRSFIKRDIEIILKRYEIIENTYDWKNITFKPFIPISQFLSIVKNIFFIKLIIIEMGGYWAFLPSIFGAIFKIPVLIVLCGADCSSFPEIRYGSLRKPLLKLSLFISYRLATKLLPISDSLIYTENNYALKDKVVKQGYKHVFKNIATDCTVINRGFDPEEWKIIKNSKRNENRFMTVLSDVDQFHRKGGELIIEVAKEFPEFEFYFAGIRKPNLLKLVPLNVYFLGRSSPKELLQNYNSSKYYLQLSLYEGFCNSLCEAMLCGCIPIVSNVNMLPEIIGDTGYVLDERNPRKLVQLIKEISTSDQNQLKGHDARRRIIENFSSSKREHYLMKIINEYMNI